MRSGTSLPHDEIRAQLARIVSSRQFSNAPRLSRFLTYVVEQKLAGRSDQLKGYTIGLEVFDKEPDFDPQTDTIVRVQARALRQKLEQYYLRSGANDPIRIFIAKGGYDPTYYSPNDVNSQSEESTEPRERDASDIPIASKPSIAVLPFECIGLGTNCEYVGIGLTGGVISSLSQFKDLSVFSRSTTERAKTERLSIRQMFQRFQPDFVLEGSFRLRKEMIEARIRLIDAATDAVIMADKIEVRMEVDHLYEAQDEMVARIAAHIAVEYGPIGHYSQRAACSKTSMKWETYAWISRYFQYGLQLDQKERDEIEAGLKHAVSVDPTSSDAHAALSMIEIEHYRVMTADVGDPARLEQAAEHARLAVRYDPQSAMAHQAMAMVRFHEKRFVDFRASVRRALQLNPGHSDMMAMFGICFVRLAAWDEALPLLDRAFTLNPMHPDWYHMPKAMYLMMNEGPQEAIAEFTKSPMPGLFAFHFILLWFHIEAGDLAEADVEKERLLAIAPDVEEFARRYFDAICLCDEIADRAITACRKIGLNIGK